MDRIKENEAETLQKPGISSIQLISAKSGQSENVAITKVTVAPGGFQDRHSHASSEQIWIVLQGRAVLLLDEGREESAISGETVRFAQGEVHGVENRSGDDFVYISVTSPPEVFDAFYDKK